MTELDCLCKVTYTSPKGKNHYTNTKLYSLSDLVRHYNIVVGSYCHAGDKRVPKKENDRLS